MRVLHVITGLDQGGGQSALFRVVTSGMPGVEHVVVSLMDRGVYGDPMQAAGIEVHSLGIPAGRVSLRGLVRLWTLMRRLRPDVVQTWMYHADVIGGVVARLAGRSAVVWGVVNFNLAPEMISRRTRAVVRLAGMLSRIVPRRIVSCATAAIGAHEQLGYDTDRFRTVHLGFDATSEGKPAERRRFRDAHGITSSARAIGCVARWDPQKDHRTLLLAFATVARDRDVRCVLIGPGMTAGNTALAALLAETGTSDRVTLVGPVRDLPDAMVALDLHVLASRGEAFPNVLCEAMLNGVPCVATNVGDVTLIVGDTGWVVPPGDAAALAHALESALAAMDDAPRWAERQDACRRRVRSLFTTDRMVAGYRAVWDEARA